MNTFFIADTHFDDEKIINYENRPFKDVNDMNESIISRWNDIVSNNDIIYLLGDIGNEGFIKRLNGVKYLVKGNHDTKANEDYRKVGFAEVYDQPIIWNNFWILSHEPMYVNENMPYANLFGHVHNSPLYKTFSKHHYCISAERINYTPISFEEVKINMLS
jgi:calcineurin-like phosphoesterase family protein